MRNQKLTATFSIAAILISLTALVSVTWLAPPKLDRSLHARIGAALAQETLQLLRPGGKVYVISRDTEAFRQPTLEILMQTFQKNLAKGGASLGAVHKLEVDPLRPVDVPAGDFYELIRRATANDVIVSLLGPPFLTMDQRGKLGQVKPRIVAFCPGDLGLRLDLKSLFEAGILHAAITGRDQLTTLRKTDRNDLTYDQLYTSVRGGDQPASTLHSTNAP
jgi:hypothetical protein